MLLALSEGGALIKRPRLSPATQASLLGLLVAIVGLAGVLMALVPPWPSRMRLVESLWSPEATHLATGATALLGLTLIFLGRGLARRRRAAYGAATILLAAATAAHLVMTLDVEAALATALIDGLLIWRRELFIVPVTQTRLITVAQVTGWLIVADLAYGVVGLLTHLGSIHPSLTPVSAVEQVGSSLVGVQGPLVVDGRFGNWFLPSLTVLGTATIIGALGVAFAPLALGGVDGHEDEREELLALIDRRDGDTLDPFVLRRDKRRVFSPDRRAAMGLRYVDGVGLAAGDPVGDPASFSACVQEFLHLCERHGWRPAVMGAREDRLPLYRDHGLRSLYIGDEAIIDVPGFTLEGRRMRNARQGVNRSRNAGVTTRILRERELDPVLREALLDVAATQRGDFREFGFSMALGELLSGEDRDCVIAVSRGADGQPVAFQRYVPCRRGAALSLDAMRRRPDAPNGVHERMIVDTVAWAREHDVAEISLNFAAFRSLFDTETDLAPVQAAAAKLLRRMDGTLGIQIDTLRRFNAKFEPRWVRRHLVFRGAADIPAIGLAALSAEGFLPFDRRRLEAQPQTLADAQPR